MGKLTKYIIGLGDDNGLDINQEQAKYLLCDCCESYETKTPTIDIIKEYFYNNLGSLV